jgi:hypothetical protein
MVKKLLFLSIIYVLLGACSQDIEKTTSRDEDVQTPKPTKVKEDQPPKTTDKLTPPIHISKSGSDLAKTKIIPNDTKQTIVNNSPSNSSPKPSSLFTISNPVTPSLIQNKLKSNIHSMDLMNNCKYVSIGGSNMDASVYTTKGKQLWYRDDVRNVCKGENCREGAFVRILDKKHLFVALNGDTIRKLSFKKGSIGPFRGGFNGKISDFFIFSSRKYVAALYPQKLSIWRTSVGMVGSFKFSAIKRIFPGNKTILAYYGDKISSISTRGKEKYSSKIIGKFIDAIFIEKTWILLFNNKIEKYNTKLKILKTIKVPMGFTHLKLINSLFGVTIISYSRENLFLLSWKNGKFTARKMAGIKKTLSPLVVSSNKNCYAIGIGKSLWFGSIK